MFRLTAIDPYGARHPFSLWNPYFAANMSPGGAAQAR
jgi:hypothetical protein